VTLVVDRPEAVYSGMVPGFVAGQYQAHELEIDVRPLARRAGAAVVVAAAIGIDAAARRVALAGRPPLPFDVASLDVGASVAGLELPGVASHALATRPIGRFVEAVAGLVARARRRGRCRAGGVGGGAGGIELACALRARLAREGVADARVALLERGPRLLAGAPARVARRVAEALARRGIELRTGVCVEAVEADADGAARRVRLAGGDALAADEVLWASGAAPLPWLADTGLPTDAAGFVRVGATLEVEGVPGLFAAGDCAAFTGPGGPLPKAGVYAVREGPILDRNLRAALAGRALRPYRPQRDFLALLNRGDGAAIGVKWGRAAAGRALFALKDRIDRRFVRRFQVLGRDDART